MKNTLTLLIFLTVTFLKLLGQGEQRAVYKDSTDAVYGYYEYLPEGYDTQPDEDFPLVIFLHGLGELGNGNNDLSKVTKNGPPKKLKGDFDLPAIVISPQSTVWWKNATLDSFLEWLVVNYRIDESRVYMTGLSMGGGGTWDYAVSYPEKLAAIVPVCGASTVKNPESLVDMAIWAFHNSGDSKVSVNNTYGWIEGIENAGGSPKMTIYDKTGHDAWTDTYDDHKMWDWLFAQDNIPSGIHISHASIYPSIISGKKGADFEIFIFANDDNGEVENVEADLSSMGMSPSTLLSKLNDTAFYFQGVLSKKLEAANYNIPITLTDNEGNTETIEKKLLCTNASLSSDSNFDSIYINLTKGVTQGSPWNNIDGSPVHVQQVTNFVSVSGTEYSFWFTSAGEWGGYSEWGAVTGDNSGIYPDNVLNVNWYVDNTTGKIIFQNLYPDILYSFTLFGSRKDATKNKKGEFDINGIKKTLKAGSNTQNTVHYKDIIPNGNGEIVVSIKKVQGNDHGFFGAIVMGMMQNSAYEKPNLPDKSTVIVDGNISNSDPLNLYPNPFIDGFEITLNQEGETIEEVLVFDMSGKRIDNTEYYSDQTANVNIPAATKGIYVVRVITSLNIYHRRLIKQ